MKSISNVIILGALLLLVFVYFNNQNPSQAKPVKTVQSTPFSNSNLATQAKTESTDKVDKSISEDKVSSSVFVNFKNSKNSSKTDDSDLDYVTAYREWQYFANCYTDVEDFHNEKDPLETLAGRFDTNARESQDEPTQVQNTYYSLHVQECKRLVEDDSDDYFTIMTKLRNRFESTAAETDEEKGLEHALEMLEQLEKFKFEFSRISRGELSSTSEEAKAIELQIQQLSDEILFIYESNDDLSELQVQQIEILSNEIEVLRSRQVQTRVVNQQALEQVSTRLDGYINSIDDFMVNNHSADAFMILAKAIYDVEYFSKESTIYRRLKNDIAIYDAYYINLLNQVAIPMVACSMGYPCDSRSELVLSLCLGLKDSMFIQACDNNLLDFYFNYYIGPSQMEDVNLYVNYLKHNYAK